MTMKTHAFTIHVPKETRGWGDNKRELPALHARVEVQIDVEQIAQHHGQQAARNKGKSRRLLNGMVVVKVLSAKEQTW